jgi:chromosomal replication initiation ATPase DnaA
MTYDEIRSKVADVCGAEIELNFVNQSNKRKYLYPRIVVAYHLFTQGWRIVDIGYVLNRDHSTISYYIKRYDDEYRYNEEFRNLADEILK